MDTWARKTLARLRGWRFFTPALYGTLILLALLFYGLGDGWFRTTPRDGPQAKEETLEARLEDILSTVRGAGRVRVLVTYATAGERVAATVSTRDASSPPSPLRAARAPSSWWSGSRRSGASSWWRKARRTPRCG